MKITYQLKRFHNLSNQELYSILKLRQEIFIVEQNCPYLDNDDLDQESFHLTGYHKNNIVAYTRLVPPGLIYDGYAAIGRVINAKSVRGMGIGRDIMKRSLEISKMVWPEANIKISAQSYLKDFYSSLGFQKVGEEYLEDGIAHIGMVIYYNGYPNRFQSSR